MATAGTGRFTRRGGQRSSTLEPEDFGTALRDARQHLGATLAEIRDRTGVAFELLEALEAMDLARLPDQRTVVTVARRYSEVVGLDPSEICGKALGCWQDQHLNKPANSAPATRSDRQRRRQPDPSVPRARRTNPRRSREAPGELGLVHHDTGTNSHLRSFTHTAEVPFVADRGATTGVGASHFADTDSVPVTWMGYRVRHRTPLWLRATVLVTAGLLLLGLAGLAVHHYEPNWLTEIHLSRQTPGTNEANRPPADEHGAHPSAASATTSNSGALVTEVSDGTGAATATVRAANYRVVIVAQEPCWIEATTTVGSPPVFAGVLQAGDTESLTPVGDRFSVEFGSSFATVGIEVGGKVSSRWLFRPPAAPFTLTFVPGAAA